MRVGGPVRLGAEHTPRVGAAITRASARAVRRRSSRSGGGSRSPVRAGAAGGAPRTARPLEVGRADQGERVGGHGPLLGGAGLVHHQAAGHLARGLLGRAAGARRGSAPLPRRPGPARPGGARCWSRRSTQGLRRRRPGAGEATPRAREDGVQRLLGRGLHHARGVDVLHLDPARPGQLAQGVGRWDASSGRHQAVLSGLAQAEDSLGSGRRPNRGDSPARTGARTGLSRGSGGRATAGPPASSAGSKAGGNRAVCLEELGRHPGLPDLGPGFELRRRRPGSTLAAFCKAVDTA